MYSSRDVSSDISQSLSSPETIRPDVPPPVDQSYRYHSVSSAHHNHIAAHDSRDELEGQLAALEARINELEAKLENKTPFLAWISHLMTGPWRLPGLRSLTNIAGKIHLVRHTPRLASENHVTVPAQPPRRVFRKADSLSSPILGVALHDLGGQSSAGADHTQNVAEQTASSSKIYDIFSLRKRARRKQRHTVARPSSPHPPTIPPPPPGLLSRRALPEASSGTPLHPKSKELREQNQAPFRQAQSPHKRGVIRPRPQQVDLTLSDQPFVITPTYPPASLNYPGMSASPSSSYSAQPLRTYPPPGPLPSPEKPRASRVEAPSKLTRYPNEGEGRAPPNACDPKNSPVTPNDQVYTNPPRERKEGLSSAGQAVARATADVSATFNACYEPPAMSRYKRDVQQTSLENRSTVVLKALDPQDANGDVITDHSEDANCDVFVDADSASDNSSSWSKPESISNPSVSTASVFGTGSSENGLW